MNEKMLELCYGVNNGRIRHFHFDGRGGHDFTEEIDIDIMCCKNCLEIEYKEDDVRHDCFWYKCYCCDINYCEHYDVICGEGYSYWCLECILDNKTWYGNCDIFKKWLDIYDAYRNREKEALLKKIADLKTKLYYQPDGEGFVEAKEHFEELSKK